MTPGEIVKFRLLNNCPYFPEHRCTLPQIQYHYGRSLSSLRAWYSDGAAEEDAITNL